MVVNSYCLFLLLFGSIIVVSQGSSVAPFIYAIFKDFFNE